MSRRPLAGLDMACRKPSALAAGPSNSKTVSSKTCVPKDGALDDVHSVHRAFRPIGVISPL